MQKNLFSLQLQQSNLLCNIANKSNWLGVGEKAHSPRLLVNQILILNLYLSCVHLLVGSNVASVL